MIVPVSLGSRSYKITIGNDCLQDVGTVLAKFQPISSVIVLTDENVQQHGYADKVADSIENLGIPVHKLLFDPGEQIKTVGGVYEMWESLYDYGTDRKAVLVAVGGGVVGDLGGFVAATYARGIRFFQVPTTLLAQVDSSVGGKVGINLETGKNMVGAFHQPLAVLIDAETLKTLPYEQYLSGLGEVVKYGVALDAKLFRYIEANVKKIKRRESAVMQKIIANCCRIKAKIVAEDEHETKDQRILLNYGHTFGHALEVLSGYTMPHGLAVSIGTICASKLAWRLGLVNADFLEKQVALYEELGLPVDCPAEYNPDDLIRVMQHDKKSEFGKVRFVLPTGIGECRIVNEIDPKHLFNVR